MVARRKLDRVRALAEGTRRDRPLFDLPKRNAPAPADPPAEALQHLPRLVTRRQIFPAWSPDGKRIAFEVGRPSDRGGPPFRTLAVIDRDGSHRQTILRVRGYLYGRGPAWQRR